MKIAIDNIQREQRLLDIDETAREKIVGGATVEGSTSSFALLGSHIAGSNSNTFLITNKSGATTSSTRAVVSSSIDGFGFSRSSSLASSNSF